MKTVKTSHKSWREEKMKEFLGAFLGAITGMCLLALIASAHLEGMGITLSIGDAKMGVLPNVGNAFVVAPMVHVYEDEGYRPLPCVKAPADAPFCTEEE